MNSASDDVHLIRIATRHDFGTRTAIVRIVNGQEIAIFRIEDSYHAVSNVCPHQLAPVIAEGRLDGHVITCPMHGWSFDVRTGRGVSSGGRLVSHPVTFDGDALMIPEPQTPAEPAW